MSTSPGRTEPYPPRFAFVSLRVGDGVNWEHFQHRGEAKLQCDSRSVSAQTVGKLGCC